MHSQTRKKGNISADNSNSSSSVLVIASNVDLLLQILLRLPLKSLLVFKSVSKQWYSIISEPHFNHRHFLQNPRFSVPGVFWIKPFFGRGPQIPVYEYINLDRNDENGDDNAPFETITFDKVNFPIKIVQSCNGLFLCSSCQCDSSKCIYYIFNPFTRQYSILPKSIFRKGGFTYAGNVSLVYDPLRSPYYKVLCVWDVKTSLFNKRIEIYSSETKSWKRCGDGDEYVLPHLMGTLPGVMWNGMLNWLACGGSLNYFDIDREVVGGVSRTHQPRQVVDHTINSFGEYEGHLFCVEVNDMIHTRFDILEMDTNYTGWNVKYRVDLDGLRALHPRLSFCCGYNLVSFDEEVKDSPKLILLIHDSEVVISYDPKHTTSEKLCNVAPRHFPEERIPSQGSFRFYKYVESLACV